MRPDRGEGSAAETAPDCLFLALASRDDCTSTHRAGIGRRFPSSVADIFPFSGQFGDVGGDPPTRLHGVRRSNRWDRAGPAHLLRVSAPRPGGAPMTTTVPHYYCARHDPADLHTTPMPNDSPWPGSCLGKVALLREHIALDFAPSFPPGCRARSPWPVRRLRADIESFAREPPLEARSGLAPLLPTAAVQPSRGFYSSRVSKERPEDQHFCRMRSTYRSGSSKSLVKILISPSVFEGQPLD